VRLFSLLHRAFGGNRRRLVGTQRPPQEIASLTQEGE
jgi:hypothetical protein